MVIYYLNMGILISMSTSVICLFCFCVQKMWYFSMLCLAYLYYFRCIPYIPISMAHVYYVLYICRCIFVVFYCAYIFTKLCFEWASCLTCLLLGTIYALESICTTTVILITILSFYLHVLLYDTGSLICFFMFVSLNMLATLHTYPTKKNERNTEINTIKHILQQNLYQIHSLKIN
jgi:hypothetical protein